MILDKIAQSTKIRVEKAKEKISFNEIKESAMKVTSPREAFAFEKALMGKEISFICEVKKASPSKGIIAEDFPYLDIAREYEEAGAAAISVLTEPEFFMGRNAYLKEISRSVNIPVLRKDFTIDEYQIYEGKVMGADGILLICALLDERKLKNYISICDRLGMSALVEAHSEDEIETAKAAGARVIGVNNRDLKTFEVDIRNCMKLRELVPKTIVFIAESGIKTDRDIAAIRGAGVNGVLVDETLMKSHDKKAMLSYLKGERPND